MRRWTDKEISLLKQHYSTTPKRHIAEEIIVERTIEAIDRKATRLNLTKEDNFYFKWKLQQEETPEHNTELENFIIGLTAGDGSFIKIETKDQYRFTYKIEMNASQNSQMIHNIQNFFDCGRISEYHRQEYNSDVIQFTVRSIPEHIANIIPVFERNEIPAEYKRNQYLNWKQDLLSYVKSSKDKSCKDLSKMVITNGI